MFDKLEDLAARFEEIMNELADPALPADPERMTRLMKEQSTLQPIVETYKRYKKNQNRTWCR